jgi:RNA polymerase subunit RPABC4/transcription elongation factor Spt4
MPNALKSKICWNCDGTLGLEEDLCPFCGTQQDQLQAERTDRVVALPVESLQEAVNKVTPPATEKIALLDRLSEKELLLLTLVSTMLGGTLLFFTLALLLFSTNGKLTLIWDASLWPFLGFLSIALLYLSYKTQTKIKD